MNEFDAIDEYWTRCVEVGRLPLPIEGEQDVALIWHQVHENCGRGHREIGLGVMRDNAERVYVHAKACYFTPEILLTIAVTQPHARPGEQVGVIEDAQRRGSIRREFANLQAWFYRPMATKSTKMGHLIESIKTLGYPSFEV